MTDTGTVGTCEPPGVVGVVLGSVLLRCTNSRLLSMQQAAGSWTHTR
jgi:hypothetical protein